MASAGGHEAFYEVFQVMWKVLNVADDVGAVVAPSASIGM